MKALSKTLVLLLLALSSCTSKLYTGGGEYDDLYYTPSDQESVAVKPSANAAVAGSNQNTEGYYDNIYAADTLVSNDYSDAVDYEESMVYNNNSSTGGY